MSALLGFLVKLVRPHIELVAHLVYQGKISFLLKIDEQVPFLFLRCQRLDLCQKGVDFTIVLKDHLLVPSLQLTDLVVFGLKVLKSDVLEFVDLCNVLLKTGDLSPEVVSEGILELSDLFGHKLF